LTFQILLGTGYLRKIHKITIELFLWPASSAGFLTRKKTEEKKKKKGVWGKKTFSPDGYGTSRLFE